MGKAAIRVVAGILLLLCGVVLMLYSPWVQSLLLDAVRSNFSNSDDGTVISIDDLSLRFPFDICIEGLCVSQNGDTIVRAQSAEVDVNPLYLLMGRVGVRKACVSGCLYRMGAPDSAMYMSVAANNIELKPLSVALSDMNISLSDADIDGGRILMVLNQDTTTHEEDTAPSRMSVSLNRLYLHDFEYVMHMMPSIDTLKAAIGEACLNTAHIDLYEQKIHLGTFSGERLNAVYLAPDSVRLAEFVPLPETAAEQGSAAWTVSVDSINFASSAALYSTTGYSPMPGLDFGYIALGGVSLSIRDFLNRGSVVHAPLSVSGRERCGVNLAVAGTLDIDSAALTFSDFVLSTEAGTNAAFSGKLGMGDMAADPTVPLALTIESAIAPDDISDMFPAALPFTAGIPDDSPVELNGNMAGTVGSLNIDSLSLNINRCVFLNARGSIGNFMNPDRMSADIALDGSIINVDKLKDNILEPETAQLLQVPPTTLSGRVSMEQGVAAGNMKAVTAGGIMRLDAKWNSNNDGYSLYAEADTFPIQAFMPSFEIADVTAVVDIEGRGYNPFLPTTDIDAAIEIADISYRGEQYRDITVDAALEAGDAAIVLNSGNNDADMTLTAAGNLDGDTYSWSAKLAGRNFDLYALGIMEEPCTMETNAEIDAVVTPATNEYHANVTINDLYYRRMTGTIAVSDLKAALAADAGNTDVDITNHDLSANFHSPCGLDTLMARFLATAAVADTMCSRFDIRADSIQKALPPFSLIATAGSDNLINEVLSTSGMSLRGLNVYAGNDSTLHMNLSAQRFATGTMTLDSLFVAANQKDSVLYINAGVDNEPGNLDMWHYVRVDGAVAGNHARLKATQMNVEGKTGFDLGAVVAVQPDTTLTLSLYPYDPVIGYKNWTVNDSNYVAFNVPSKQITANLHMNGNGSALELYNEAHLHVDDEFDVHEEPAEDDIVVNLSNIHVQDWIALNPFATSMKGDVSANVRLNRMHGQLIGRGNASVSDFTYGRERVSDMDAQFEVSADRNGTLSADMALMVDGVKTASLKGVLNDSTAESAFNLDFSMIRFPLATINPFLPSGTAKLSGVLNGTMDVTGTADNPILNGSLDFDSTAVAVSMLGATYHFCEDSIPVNNSVIHFNNFAITGCNDKPLTVDGSIDLTDIADAKFDISLAADGMQLVDSRRAARGADVYGKAFIDLDAAIRGSMSFMVVDAEATILPETNVTYVLSDAETVIASASQDGLVTFVNFADTLGTTASENIEPEGMRMLIDATLNIAEGSIVNVDLNSGGSNKVQIKSSGSLNYTMTPMNDGRLTGRLNIDEGFARYGMAPLLSEQLFTFQRGSYVSFRGDMMNPVLDIQAVNVVKANVTQSGANSRLVDFDVSLSVSGTLERMDVAFDMSTDDDITVANELQGMTAEQRASQAMNLMLYHTYTGSGTTATTLGNPLYTFLAGQLNEWAASAIKGVDVTFGVDQYDSTVDDNTSQTTSYSYQVSKSLFNDRFKIVVGGNYTTDATADENFSQNLINDISFEYYLNRSRSMYIKLFRHTGYESILEGEITQTGVGFAYRRKLQRLGDMFKKN